MKNFNTSNVFIYLYYILRLINKITISIHLMFLFIIYALLVPSKKYTFQYI